MLLALKDDNTTGSLNLCHLFYVLGVPMISGDICTTMLLYTIVICADDTLMYVLFFYWLLFFWYAIVCAYFTIDMHL